MERVDSAGHGFSSAADYDAKRYWLSGGSFRKLNITGTYIN